MGPLQGPLLEDIVVVCLSITTSDDNVVIVLSFTTSDDVVVVVVLSFTTSDDVVVIVVLSFMTSDVDDPPPRNRELMLESPLAGVDDRERRL